MLCLSRQLGQQIKIGDEITLTLIDVRKDKILLGIDAPRTVAVNRKEVWDAIQQSKPEPQEGEA